MTESLADDLDMPNLSRVQDSIESRYMSLPFEQRYEAISQGFPDWLLAEPIKFPADHSTYGWVCRVGGCKSALQDTGTRPFCGFHDSEYRAVRASMRLDEFLQQATSTGHRSDWALYRYDSCRICGHREQVGHGYCQAHANGLLAAGRGGKSEEDWRHGQVVLDPYPGCSVPRCVHDGSLTSFPGGRAPRVCPNHSKAWTSYVRRNSLSRNDETWLEWSTNQQLSRGVRTAESRGVVAMAALPARLQCELRYALHRCASSPRRAQWRPRNVQNAIDLLATADVETLTDPRLAELADQCESTQAIRIRRILQSLMVAARSLTVTEADAKAAGWFDPIIVGASHFPDGTGDKSTRRKYWDLTDISQLWLRDLLWEHLRHLALGADGKRPSKTTIYQRIGGIRLLSKALRQLREDHAQEPSKLDASDAAAFKELLDLWYREQTPVVAQAITVPPKMAPITAWMRATFTSQMREVLMFGRRRNILGPWADSFLMAFPQYRRQMTKPHPRPISNEDFQLLVSEDGLALLDAADISGVGLCDIWLTHAYQGGRIGEALSLRLGCIGMIGNAQPYLWRDISKSGVIDYGMPCHLPVYERLQRRQELTRAKLRHRYAKELSGIDDRQRAALEAEWDRTMPLFPGAMTNPDLQLPLTQHHFRSLFTNWIEKLGLTGITTHRTRATLATALLNNGAPAALVRQLLGHFSEGALAHYARYSDDNLIRNLQQVWTAGPGMDQPGTVLMTPSTASGLGSRAALGELIDLTVIPVEHGLCRYGPVVGGKACPANKNCSRGPQGPCPHFVLTGADLSYWERKRDAAYHFAEGAPSEAARDYILGEWKPWETVIDGLRQTLAELGLLEAAEELDLRSPLHDFFHPLFSTGWKPAGSSDPANDQRPIRQEVN